LFNDSTAARYSGADGDDRDYQLLRLRAVLRLGAGLVGPVADGLFFRPERG